MRQPVDLQPAYLLHRRPYRNSSLLVECFSVLHGRFPAIVRGVAKRRRAAAGSLQPFIPLLLRWTGRGEVKQLTQFESSAAAPLLKGRSLYCGFYLNELLMRLLQRNDPHETLFASYSESLRLLAVDPNVEQVLRRFELALLKELGYGLVLDRQIPNGASVRPEQRYTYVLEQGPVPAGADARYPMHGSTLLALQRGDPLDKQALSEAKRLTRQVLAHYLGDRPLKSRELFRQ